MPSGDVRLAVGDADQPREYLEPQITLARLLSAEGPSLADIDSLPRTGPVLEHRVLSPFDDQPIWAAGVTFQRSREARLEESNNASFYDLVYDADRPELFLKCLPGRARGAGEPIRTRADSTWDVPEPELVLVLDSTGAIVGCTIGNDLSSRSIEAENPLYLPQAKTWDGNCALGPAVHPVGDLPPLRELEILLRIVRGTVTVFEDAVSMSTMRREFDDLASWLFRDQTFPLGAALMTGTSMVPPADLTLLEGDRVEIDVAGLGLLHNTVVADAMDRRTIEPDPVSLALRYWQAEMDGDVDAIAACFAEDATFATAHRVWKGRPSIRERYAAAAAAYPSIAVETGAPIVDGRRAAISWRATFSPVGSAPFVLTGLDVFKVGDDGLFNRVECFYDEKPQDSSTPPQKMMRP